MKILGSKRRASGFVESSRSSSYVAQFFEIPDGHFVAEMRFDMQVYVNDRGRPSTHAAQWAGDISMCELQAEHNAAKHRFTGWPKNGGLP